MVQPRGLHAVLIAALLAACAGETPPLPEGEAGSRLADSTTGVPLAVSLIDSTIPPAVAGEGGWNYQQAATADLDGDGAPERVVLTARVEMYRGRPAWDDGQPWQVYIEEADGRRTHVYARRLQLGTLSLRVSRAEAGQPAAVVLLEQLPDQMSVYEIAYAGPAAATASVRYQRDLDPRGDVASPRLP